MESKDENDGRPGTISEQIASEVAAVTGVEPTALDPPLYSVIDTDALNALFDHRSGPSNGVGVHVEFVYAGCEVVVGRDGAVDVSEASDSIPESFASGA